MLCNECEKEKERDESVIDGDNGSKCFNCGAEIKEEK